MLKDSARKAMWAKKEGKWFKGNVFNGDFSADQLIKAKKKYEKNVIKPTALRTKNINGKTYSQFYHKPIGVGEFID